MPNHSVAFVAGATGFTGRAVARQDAEAHGVELRLQVRPGSKGRASLGSDPRVVEVSIDDKEALVKSLQGCDAILQLIGTVRARFDDETSYESVDYGTTVKLLEAGREAGVSHFVLLSSIGAGLGIGSYLHWKKRTEQAVRDDGIPWTLVRPSYLAGDEDLPERRSLHTLSAFLSGLSNAPIGGELAANLRPIPIQVLARVLLHLVRAGPQRRVLKGVDLWRIAREEQLDSAVR